MSSFMAVFYLRHEKVWHETVPLTLTSEKQNMQESHTNHRRNHPQEDEFIKKSTNDELLIDERKQCKIFDTIMKFSPLTLEF